MAGRDVTLNCAEAEDIHNWIRRCRKIPREEIKGVCMMQLWQKKSQWIAKDEQKEEKLRKSGSVSIRLISTIVANKRNPMQSFRRNKNKQKHKHTFKASAFFFKSLCPPCAALSLSLKTCWFIRVGGTSAMVACGSAVSDKNRDLNLCACQDCYWKSNSDCWFLELVCLYQQWFLCTGNPSVVFYLKTKKDKGTQYAVLSYRGPLFQAPAMDWQKHCTGIDR